MGKAPTKRRCRKVSCGATVHHAHRTSNAHSTVHAELAANGVVQCLP